MGRGELSFTTRTSNSEESETAAFASNWLTAPSWVPGRSAYHSRSTDLNHFEVSANRYG